MTGEEPHTALRYRAWEIESGTADTIADLLKWLSLGGLVGAGVWWWARARGIRRGREDLAEPAVSRDFVFTVVLLLIVTSRVLSPQYMIWMLALAAVVLTARTSALKRPAWTVIVAALVTTSSYGAMGAYGTSFNVYGSPFIMLVRNSLLLFAAVDACLAMVTLVRQRGAEEESPDAIRRPAAQSPAT